MGGGGGGGRGRNGHASVTIPQTVDVTTWVATYVTGKSRDLTPQTEQNAQSLFELGLTFISTYVLQN